MNKTSLCRISRLLTLALILVILTGCAGLANATMPARTATVIGENLGLEEQAAAEATAIIQRARATALVLQAQAEATAVMDQIQQKTGADPLPVATALPGQEELPAATRAAVPVAAPGAEEEDVFRLELLDVAFAADGSLIIVRFKATRKAADSLWPGRVSVMDEATGTVYDQVPVMPVVGLLVGRTRNFGPIGYVMFKNTAPGLPPGARVTVTLDQFKQEHVLVKADGLKPLPTPVPQK